jgi:hypothetical protein
LIDEKWDELLKDLRFSLQDVATIVSADEPGGRAYGFAQVKFHPQDGEGTPISLACLGTPELLLFYGDGRARWELDWSPQDVKFLKDVVRAVCTGNSREISAPGRIHVEVLLPDGSTVKTSTYEFPMGLIPMPGWKKRGRKTRSFLPVCLERNPSRDVVSRLLFE